MNDLNVPLETLGSENAALRATIQTLSRNQEKYLQDIQSLQLLYQQELAGRCYAESQFQAYKDLVDQLTQRLIGKQL